ncbi:unnamed protein product [Orchesella dallaii]|uniref:C2H2-type domain-containing protein n=1 Tax=Orchesella dallaii TaxID=48710 RepID=A0ABP1QPT2_9HEXA
MKPKTRPRNADFRCLFCLKSCPVPNALLEPEDIHGAVRCIELQKQLQQLFILRQLLDIPSSWCEEMLQRNGGDSNPESWFRICHNCMDTVKDAWKAYQKLLSILERMSSLKEQVKNVMLENIYKSRRKVGLIENEIRGLVFPEEMDSLLLNEQEQTGIKKSNDMNMVEVDYDGSSDFNPGSPIDLETSGNEDEMGFDDVGSDRLFHPKNSSKSKKSPTRKIRISRAKRFNQDGERRRNTMHWKICKMCPTRFKHDDDYQAHVMAHEDCKRNDGKFECRNCGFPAKDEIDLEQHTFDKHLNPKFKIRTYKCIKCEYQTGTWKDLKAHANEEHPDADEEELGVELHCKVCSKVCENRSALMLHMKKTHPEAFGAEEENLNCDQCSMRFPNKIVLQYHINNTHRRVTKYICDDCGKGFRYDKALQRHQISHNKGKREFVCHICGCEYAYKSVLETHYRKFHPQTNEDGRHLVKTEDGDNSASNPELFNCKYCELSSPHRIIIIRHMQTHKTEMGHQCDICLKYYVNIQGLRRHKRINHPTTLEEHKCPHCFKVFNSIDYMKNHAVKYCKVKLLDEKAQTQSSTSAVEMIIDSAAAKEDSSCFPDPDVSIPSISAEEFKVSTVDYMEQA